MKTKKYSAVLLVAAMLAASATTALAKPKPAPVNVFVAMNEAAPQEGGIVLPSSKELLDTVKDLRNQVKNLYDDKGLTVAATADRADILLTVLGRSVTVGDPTGFTDGGLFVRTQIVRQIYFNINATIQIGEFNEPLHAYAFQGSNMPAWGVWGTAANVMINKLVIPLVNSNRTTIIANRTRATPQ